MNTLIIGSLYVLGVLFLVLLLILPLLMLVVEFRKKNRRLKKAKRHHPVAGRKTFGANRIKGKGNSQAMGNIINHYTEAGISEREESFVETINILIQNNHKLIDNSHKNENRHTEQVKYLYAQNMKLSEENDALWDENTRLKFDLQEMANRVPFVELRFPKQKEPEAHKLTG